MTIKLGAIHLITDACAACGESMNDSESNQQPTWSDAHDDVVCWYCSNHAPSMKAK